MKKLAYLDAVHDDPSFVDRIGRGYVEQNRQKTRILRKFFLTIES